VIRAEAARNHGDDTDVCPNCGSSWSGSHGCTVPSLKNRHDSICESQHNSVYESEHNSTSVS
jgi:hypothetical protein